MHSKANSLTIIIADVIISSLITMISNRGAVLQHHPTLTLAGEKSLVPLVVRLLCTCSHCSCCRLKAWPVQHFFFFFYFSSGSSFYYIAAKAVIPVVMGEVEGRQYFVQLSHTLIMKLSLKLQMIQYYRVKKKNLQ